METIHFTLNGIPRQVECEPTTTLMEWLREEAGLTGTKEGCNEGDCGACTVIICSNDRHSPPFQTVNSCIQFLPQIKGKSILTVEGVSHSNDTLHPVQEAMVSHNGNQCGFCTPGFIMSMVAAHTNQQADLDVSLAGNLCRCTGYDSIHKAGLESFKAPVPDWIEKYKSLNGKEKEPEVGTNTNPKKLNAFAEWYYHHPDSTVIAGATDVGLLVNKSLQSIHQPIFIAEIKELKKVTSFENQITFGAAVNFNVFEECIRDFYPSLSSMIIRFGSVQVRNSATIGGNIGNGSPIGDSPPALIAIGSRLVLRRNKETRTMPLEKFFIDYGVQDLRKGEFIEKIIVPTDQKNLRCYKISKRFDQDISALCGCFNFTLDGQIINNARIAFGGMAATPKRAYNVEQFLIGMPFDEKTIQDATDLFFKDYQPISDMRATKKYRIIVAQNLLKRYFLDLTQKFDTSDAILEINSL